MEECKSENELLVLERLGEVLFESGLPKIVKSPGDTGFEASGRLISDLDSALQDGNREGVRGI